MFAIFAKVRIFAKETTENTAIVYSNKLKVFKDK